MKLANLISRENWNGTVKLIGMKLTAVRPEIMLLFGFASVLGGTIYACTKTEKAKDEIYIVKSKAETVKKETEFDPEGLTKEEIRHKKIEQGKKYVDVYAPFAYKMLKIYGIPALLWFGGMGMIFGSHGELRKTNKHLIADGVAAKKLFDEYRGRVAKAVGEETEEKIFMGAQEGMVQVIEKDEETGEERVVQKKADIFYTQPGSIFARNFTEETSDAFDIRSFAEHYLDSRIDSINKNLDLGVSRAYTALDILRMLGFNENALGEGAAVDALIHYGISGNARKVPDPEMRKLKVTRLRGYQKKWDVAKNMEVYVPCLRLDFNFYPLEGKI